MTINFHLTRKFMVDVRYQAFLLAYTMYKLHLQTYVTVCCCCDWSDCRKSHSIFICSLRQSITWEMSRKKNTSMMEILDIFFFSWLDDVLLPRTVDFQFLYWSYHILTGNKMLLLAIVVISTYAGLFNRVCRNSLVTKIWLTFLAS